MDRTYKKGIYNYCEKMWDKLKEEDGAYYPSKHDDLVFDDAAKHFNLSVNQIKDIHGEVSRELADARIKGMTKEQMLSEMKQIAENNAETPWGKK